MTLTDTREAVGPNYSLEAIRSAQAETWRALRAIAAEIRPGMRESEAQALGEAILAQQALDPDWHPLLIRFGPNTLKIFSEKGEGDPVLGDNDIYFIDMGPVFLGHEGDAGDTFTTGSDPEMVACAAAVRTLYDRVQAIWRQGGIGGTALYEAAAREAEAMGWVLNLEIKGHRVSDYPHRALPPGGQLGTLDREPGAGLWILEIQIRHPTRPFGAFFEDLLD
jgi:Xaa-Pro aminopeptidase